MGVAFFCPFSYLKAIIIFCSALGFPSVAMATRGGNETDRLALLAFKAEITADPFGVLSSWNESINFCQWRGVICSHRHQRVVMLNLRDQKLMGPISPHIGNLSFLRYLYLSNNSFTHEIPLEIGRLRRLEELRLPNNSVSGEIPANISGCSNLIHFVVSRNNLTGKIPEELGSLLKLQVLYLSLNNLIGSIPPSLGNLSSLVRLECSYNNLTGTIPSALGQLTRLDHFGFQTNGLSGSIPLGIFNISSMTVFGVGENQIQGSLPSDLGFTLPNINYIGIFRNHFTGSIPASLSNASKLTSFMAWDNNLTGKVPSFEKLHKLFRFGVTSNHLGSGEVGDLSFISSLTNATNLEVLAINANNFAGMLPESFNNLSTKLWLLYIDDNRISGTLPTGIGNFVNLEDVEMGNNQLTGQIPTDIGKLQKLHVLNMHGNEFSGNIPSSLGDLSLLTVLILRGNSLSGKIPSRLGNCQNLLVLDLAENNLTGTIPRQVFGLTSLSLHLDLSDNFLTGSLPVEVGNLKNLGGLYLSNNILSGEIPSTLGKCVTLESLYMNGNFFQGTIPSSFSTLKGIQFLDLSHNNLSGLIPEYFASFYMQILNLSFNHFEGALPIGGTFTNASAIFVNGNNKLCGGIPELQLPACNLKGSKKRRSRVTPKIIIIPIALGLSGLTSLLCFTLWLRKKRKPPLPAGSAEYSLLRVSYQSLVKATNGFSSTNLLGVGSFGSVYRGILDDGRTIAVKVLNLQRHGASRSFTAECEALKNIRHRNLVKVLTACSSVDYKGNDFKAVVYEFMVNGSLEDWLHPIPKEDEPHDEQRHLNLLQRLNIAIDVASALDYLHNHCPTVIVHCDVKPSNVLLDDELTGRVGDFGLARLLLEGTRTFSSSQTSSIGIKGSIGYTPPEYGMGSEVSTSGDVYSYGILLLEIFTRKRPTDDMFSGNLNLHNFAKMAIPEQAVKISDPTLLQQDEEAETSTRTNDTRNWCCDNKISQCLIDIYRIGIACSAELPRERMDISNVVAELLVIKNSFLGVHKVHDNN